MKVTAQWIADQCGVSRGTVDRVVNGRPNVAPNVRERVQKLVNEYGYQTPAQRQAARLDGVTYRIGAITPGWDVFAVRRMKNGIISSGHYFDRCGIQIAVEEVRERSGQAYKDAISRLAARHIHGLVVAVPEVSCIAGEIERLRESGVRIASCGYDVLPEAREFYIGPDLGQCGRVAAGLLAPFAGEGGALAVTSGTDPEELAAKGFMNRICELAKEPVNVHVLKGGGDYASTYKGVKGLIKGNPVFGAVYTESGSLKGCMDALAETGNSAYVACQGFTPRSRRYLAEGRINFVLDHDGTIQAVKAIGMLSRIIRTGISLGQAAEYLPVSIITREMV